MGRLWVAFFSQTGSEIANISEQLNRWPDLIIVNERNIERTIDSRLQNQNVKFVSNRPTTEELYDILSSYNNPIVTLHGWLRIMPPSICKSYDIYNGHPGLITEYPELKGKDPQIRAFEAKHEVAGCVLHKVTSGVDEGAVLMEEHFNAEGVELNELFRILKDRSLFMWVKFLRKEL
tara:strand:- start:37974 stop:38504 length:531 start_codon:yes stop_codon:yes gene_type:complete